MDDVAAIHAQQQSGNATAAVVESSLASLLRGVRRALEEVDDVSVVVNILKQIAALLLPPESASYGGRPPSSSDRGKPPSPVAALDDDGGGEPSVKQQYPAVCAVNQHVKNCVSAAKSVLPNNAAEEDHLALIRNVLYRGNCFFTFAELLLYEVAPDWLACFTSAQQWALFDAFFLAAPALVVLQALAPKVSSSGSGSARQYPDDGEEEETNAAQRAAERLIVLRLLGMTAERERWQISGGGKEGIREIALELGEFAGAESIKLKDEERVATNRGQGSKRGGKEEFVREMALLVVSLPDRASSKAAQQLTTPSFFQLVLQQLIIAGNECERSSLSGTEIISVGTPSRRQMVGMEKEEEEKDGATCEGTSFSAEGEQPKPNVEGTETHDAVIGGVRGHCGRRGGEGTYIFIAEVITRMCRRGHADLLAVEMVRTLIEEGRMSWQKKWTPRTGDARCGGRAGEREGEGEGEGEGKRRGGNWWATVAAKMVDLHASERWLESLMRYMAKIRVPDRDAVVCLDAVLGKSVLANPIIRSLFAERFLLQRPLPLACLHWILALGVMRSSSSLMSGVGGGLERSTEKGASSSGDVEEEVGGDTNTEKQQLLRQTLGRLAAVWGSSQFVQNTEIRLQGYISTALAMCLGHVSRRMIDDIPDLMPSILQGVSARLDSPLMPIRRTGMRVAEAFSRSFDPGNVLIFEEEGEIGAGDAFLWEEGWWGDPGHVKRELLGEGRGSLMDDDGAGGKGSASAAIVSPGKQERGEGECGETVRETAERMEKGGQDRESRQCRGGGGGGGAVDLDKEREGCVETVVKKKLRSRRRERREKLAMEEDDPDAVINLTKGGKQRGLASDDEDEASSSDPGDSISGSQYSEEDSLEPYDLSDDEEDLEREKVPGQLRLCMLAFNKTDDPDGVTRALGVVEGLIRAMPDELDDYSAQLTSKLLRVSPNDITVAGAEAGAAEKRHRALVALLTCSTLPSLKVLLKEVYSPHMDSSHRLVILDAMEDAALELSSLETSQSFSEQRSLVQELTPAEGPSKTPWWGPPPPGSLPGPTTSGGPWVEARLSQGLLTLPRYERELPLLPGTKEAGTSRRWGHSSLRLRREAQLGGKMPGTSTRMNRFAPYAATFTLPLMRDYDKVDGTLRLVSRDFFVFGRLLHVLGVFITCSAPSVETVPLATALLELLQTRGVSQHKEAYVRQSALEAATCVIISLSPSNVVAALGDSGGVLVRLLAWVSDWAKAISENDSDGNCILLAERCLLLHARLMGEALGSVEIPSSQSPVRIDGHPQSILIQPLCAPKPAKAVS